LLDMQPWVMDNCCMVDEQLTFDVWLMNNVWWSWILYGGWTCRCMIPFGTYFWYVVDELCTIDNVVYIFSLWYWLFMCNGCLYVCLAFGTDFWLMMVVYMFNICFWILMDHSSNSPDYDTPPVAI
jgi:hypothetical protein